MTTGGCFCGLVRYEISGAVRQVGNCHCTMCRRTSGAAFVTWLIVRAQDFRYTTGEPAVLNSSDRGTRWFCNRCGTPMTCVTTAHPDYVDVTLGSLDDPTPYPPDSDFHTDTRLDWVGPPA